jgi:drug/metabolite transporter (DMT)-like permease
MNVARLLPWLALLLFETGANLTMKLGSAQLEALSGAGWLQGAMLDPWIWAAAGCYLASFFSWMVILRSSALTLAFPASSMVLVTVMLAAWLVLGERIALWNWAGVALIMTGVFLLDDGTPVEARQRSLRPPTAPADGTAERNCPSPVRG